MFPDAAISHHIFRLANDQWYEPLAQYRPDPTLLLVARSCIPPNWRLLRNGQWVQAAPPVASIPQQGWKIHVSATPHNCVSVLDAVARLCSSMDTPFKFLVDEYIVRLSTGKGWPREAAGKFITIYPKSDRDFELMIEEAHAALIGFDGPYILSDRRYKDNKILYYRYGGMQEYTILTVSGQRAHMLMAPDGKLVADERRAYWNAPYWAHDPFGTQEQTSNDLALAGGRYRIESALSFNVSGGVYRARDHASGKTVVIKEARPATGISESGTDAVRRLKKEYRVLCRLAETGIAPFPVDFFSEWEHVFLVEEYVDGLHLGAFTIAHNPLMRAWPTDEAMSEYVRRIVGIWKQVSRGLSIIHEGGIRYGDFSLLNVLVRSPSDETVVFIDWESAWEENIDIPENILTPGFTSSMRSQCPGNPEDVYGLGVLMLGTLFPTVNLLDIEPRKRWSLVGTYSRALGLPSSAQDILQTCLSEKPEDRPTAAEVFHRLGHNTEESRQVRERRLLGAAEIRELISGITRYIRASGDPQRDDRLFPADPRVFLTNGVGVAYGGAGVAYALHRIDGEVPSWTTVWLLSRVLPADDRPPGLYVGTSGIAWAMAELGYIEVGEQLLEVAATHPLLYDTADIMYGSAGFGLTCLKYHGITRRQVWLDRAVEAGERLLAGRAHHEQAGNCWVDEDGNIWLGHARGASGIARFLLYLGLITGVSGFIEAGEAALAFDLAHLGSTEEGHLSVPRGAVGSEQKVFTHYWLDGSAGIVSTLVRFWAYTGRAEYLRQLEQLIPDIDRQYTAFPGFFRGLAGLGNSLLDVYSFTGDVRHLLSARRAAAGISIFALERETGIAFPGEQLFRISTDYSSGGAGIGLFLDRLASADDPGQDFDFTLDDLVPDALMVRRRCRHAVDLWKSPSASALEGEMSLTGEVRS